MSQSVRRILAALGLAAALLVAAPAPSRAAGLWEIPALPGLTARLSIWLEGLLPGAPREASHRRVVTEKQTTASSFSPTAPTSSTTSSDQGSAIDPNGVHR
jgi:hypothetical protein